MDYQETPATIDSNDLVVITHPINGTARKYRRVISGVWWGDPQSEDTLEAKNGLAVVGEMEDHSIGVLRTFQGNLPQLCAVAVDWKDLFAVSRVYVSLTPSGHYEMLRKADGLRDYKTVPPFVNLFGKPVYAEKEPGKKWPHFVNRNRKAAILAYNEHLTADFFGAIELVEDLIKRGQVKGDMAFLPEIDRVRGLIVHERIKSPDYKAMIAATWQAFKTIKLDKIDDDQQKKETWVPYYRRHEKRRRY